VVNLCGSDKHYHEGRTNYALWRSTHHPLPIREFLPADHPRHRLAHHGATALSDAELLAVITGVPCLETAQRLLSAAGGLRGLLTLSTDELQQLVAGISAGRAAQLKAAIELGARVARGDRLARGRSRVQPTSPTCCCWR
jgi:DNA repair protein RadC